MSLLSCQCHVGVTSVSWRCHATVVSLSCRRYVTLVSLLACGLKYLVEARSKSPRLRRCQCHVTVMSVMPLVMLLSCHRQFTDMSLLCHCYVTVTYITVMSLLWHCHDTVMSLSCHCHVTVTVISFPHHCHAPAKSQPSAVMSQSDTYILHVTGMSLLRHFQLQSTPSI